MVTRTRRAACSVSHNHPLPEWALASIEDAQRIAGGRLEHDHGRQILFERFIVGGKRIAVRGYLNDAGRVVVDTQK